MTRAGTRTSVRNRSPSISAALPGDLLRNIVFAHLDSDLPLVLWWQGDLNENFDERLYSRIDRLLVNSDKWDEPEKSFEILRRALEDTNNRLSIHDLSWSRSYHFRLAIASLFDDQAALAHLTEISDITITYEDGVPLAARMLSTWIKEILQRPAIRFHQIGRGAGANLTGITFAAGEATFSITRESGSRYLKTRIDCPEKAHETLSPAGPERRSELIAELMARAGSNSRYREVLQWLKIR